MHTCVNISGLKDMESGDEYYFRDSFDQSSSESQLHDLGGKVGLSQSHRSSRSQTPQPGHHRLKPGISRTSLQTSSLLPGQVVPLPAPPPPSTTEKQKIESSPGKKFNLFQVSFSQTCLVCFQETFLNVIFTNFHVHFRPSMFVPFDALISNKLI